MELFQKIFGVPFYLGNSGWREFSIIILVNWYNYWEEATADNIWQMKSKIWNDSNISSPPKKF